MVAIPTNARTTIRVNVSLDAAKAANDAWLALHDGKTPVDWRPGLQPYLIEFTASEPDLVRLYSVDGDPSLVLVETYETEGALTLECRIGPHGAPTATGTNMPLEIDADATPPGDLTFDVA